MSRLDNEIRTWIEEHVEKHMDWKGVKALLGMSEDKIDKLVPNESIFAVVS